MQTDVKDFLDLALQVMITEHTDWALIYSFECF